jgi:hypothetical protein
MSSISTTSRVQDLLLKQFVRLILPRSQLPSISFLFASTKVSLMVLLMITCNQASVLSPRLMTSWNHSCLPQTKLLTQSSFRYSSLCLSVFTHSSHLVGAESSTFKKSCHSPSSRDFLLHSREALPTQSKISHAIRVANRIFRPKQTPSPETTETSIVPMFGLWRRPEKRRT